MEKIQIKSNKNFEWGEWVESTEKWGSYFKGIFVGYGESYSAVRDGVGVIRENSKAIHYYDQSFIQKIQHKTDGQKCWCNPKIIKVNKIKK